MDRASALELFKEAVQQQQIKISLHAAEEALAEHITPSEIEENFAQRAIPGRLSRLVVGAVVFDLRTNLV